MTRDEMIVRSHAYQKETVCGEQERMAFFDGCLEANDSIYKEQFSLADLLAVRLVLEDRLDRLRKDRDSYRGRDMIRYEEKDIKYQEDPYFEKAERVVKMIKELIEKI